MFLRNWYKILALNMYSSEKIVGKSTGGTDIRLASSGSAGGVHEGNRIVMFGDLSAFYTNGSIPNMTILRTSHYGGGGVIFGTGDASPTLDDYKLSGNVISTITASAAVSVTEDDNGYTWKGVYTVTNTGSSDITIREVGLQMYTGVNLNTNILVERTILDSPVTIAAGGVGQVTYTIRMNYPT